MIGDSRVLIAPGLLEEIPARLEARPRRTPGTDRRRGLGAWLGATERGTGHRSHCRFQSTLFSGRRPGGFFFLRGPIQEP